MAGLTARAIAQNEADAQAVRGKLGPGNFDTLVARNNLGLAYRDAGRLSEALGLFESALRRLEIRPGGSHPLTLECRNNLAAAYESLGRYREAEELERGTLARHRKGVKAGSPVLAPDLSALARNLLHQQRWSDAEPLLRECVAILPEGRTRRLVLLRLAEHARRVTPVAAPLRRGRTGARDRLRGDGLATSRQSPCQQRSRLREAAERVVRLYEAWNKPQDAAAWKSKVGMPDLPAQVIAAP